MNRFGHIVSKTKWSKKLITHSSWQYQVLNLVDICIESSNKPKILLNDTQLNAIERFDSYKQICLQILNFNGDKVEPGPEALDASRNLGDIFHDFFFCSAIPDNHATIVWDVPLSVRSEARVGSCEIGEDQRVTIRMQPRDTKKYWKCHAQGHAHCRISTLLHELSHAFLL